MHASKAEQGSLRPTKWSSSLLACCADPCVSCGVSGGIYLVLLAVMGHACFYSCFYRTKMRAKFNLGEFPCNDCLVHWCYELCALCQEYRELKERGYDPALGWVGNLRKQQGGMGTAMAAPAYPTMAR